MTNTNPETGIRYGIISANSLHPEVADFLLYSWGAVDLSRQEAEAEALKEAECEAEAIEEEVRVAAAELDYALLSNDNLMEEQVEAAYERLGFQDREDFIQCKVERSMENWYCEEPIIEGVYEGVKYRTSWLQSLHFWVFESPHTGHFAECSPCVPCAGNLDCPDPHGVLTYDVPPEWRWKDET